MEQMKTHLSAIVAGFRAYREFIEFSVRDRDLRKGNARFLEAAKSDPLSMFFVFK